MSKKGEKYGWKVITFHKELGGRQPNRQGPSVEDRVAETSEAEAMIWFTADHHFGYENIIHYYNRPFKSLAEMDEELIYRWNAVVGRGDTVYHLGDFTLGGAALFLSLVDRLHGHIRFVPGSCDDRWMHEITSANAGKPTILPMLVTITPHWKCEQKKITLCHYAMRRWPMSHYGALHLYGHSHGKLPSEGRSMDVGVDCWDFAPVSLETVVNKLEAIPAPRFDNG